MNVDSYKDGVLPFAAMVMLEVGNVGMATLGKAAMTSGLSNFTFVVYYNALGTFILFLYYIFQRYRICLEQICAVTGIKYSSPTLAVAMGNLIPGFTFLLAVIFRMEKLALRSTVSQAKIIGTIVTISGAFIVTFYKGPPVLKVSSSLKSSLQLPLPQMSNWVLGGLLLTITCLSSATWNIVQAAIVKDYPEKMTLVFFSCFFGTIQCAVVSLFVERNLSAWSLQPSIRLFAVIYGGIHGSVIHNTVLVWCLYKKGPVYVALFKPLGTAIAVVMAIIFLGETPHLGSLIGAIVIAFGFYTVMWGQAKEKVMVADNVHSLESSTQKTPLLQNT
uniref:WAT1-related protein n=1 Tax=Fagus sylvatica TaxID=28930 RepID=A0A2N9HK19_FAGSY